MRNTEQEIREAIRAADYALVCLDNARDSLVDAGSWGIWDLLGGGFFSTFMKREGMSDAQDHLEEANIALRKLKNELEDVEGVPYINLEIDSFMKFADYFFDGFLVDWIVQGEIEDAIEKIDGTMTSIKKIKYILER